MKVLIFPALLAVAIVTTPPKPFAAGAGKAVTARTTGQLTQPTALPAQPKQPGKSQTPKPVMEAEYTARR